MVFVIAIVFSFYVSWIWIDYLRRIDLFEREKLHHLILTFFAGAVFPFLIDLFHRFLLSPEISLNGNPLNDFFYSVIVIGLVEEVVKFLPLLIILLFFKKLLNEPLDYLVYAAVSALGFAFHENIIYIFDYGIGVIGTRSVLSVPCHIFDSALFAYGFVLYRFNPGSNGVLKVITFAGLSVLSHGFYDFWLVNDTVPGGFLITILYYFITISLFATIIGNCINNSPFYHPKHTINSEKTARILFIYYGILFAALLIVLGIVTGIDEACTFYIRFIFLRFLILAILIIRLSRFRIIPARWNTIKFELPFSLMLASGKKFQVPNIYQPRSLFFSSIVHIRIKGESFNESHITSFYEEYFELHPVAPKKSYLQRKRVAFIEKKLFLFDDETFYLARIYLNHVSEKEVRYFLLKAKTKGQTRINNEFPIAALIKTGDSATMSVEALKPEDLKFMEWVILKPIRGEKA